MSGSESPLNQNEPIPAATERRMIRWDAVAAIIAALIGLLALCVSGYTAYIQRQQVRAQVWPYLEAGNFDPQQTIEMLNKGVGPALVRSVQVRVDGKSQRDWSSVLETLGLPSHGYQVSTFNGTVLSAGEQKPWIMVKDHAVYERFKNVYKTRVGVEVCFCSTLGDCWLYSDKHSVSDIGVQSLVNAVKQCPRLPLAEQFHG
jgi:hypothetical protein